MNFRFIPASPRVAATLKRGGTSLEAREFALNASEFAVRNFDRETTESVLSSGDHRPGSQMHRALQDRLRTLSN